MVTHPRPPLRELVDAWDAEQLALRSQPPAPEPYWATRPEGVGRMLRALRAHTRLSQRAMAVRIGLSKTTYAAVEAGTRELTVSQLARALMLLGWVVELRSPDGTTLLGEPKDGPRDSAGRRLPAHVEVIRVNRRASNWWGVWRWVDPDVRAPDWTYRRGSSAREPEQEPEPERATGDARPRRLP